MFSYRGNIVSRFEVNKVIFKLKRVSKAAIRHHHHENWMSFAPYMEFLFFSEGVSGPNFGKFPGGVIFRVTVVFGSKKASSFFKISIQNSVLDTTFQSPCRSLHCPSCKMLHTKSLAPSSCPLVSLNKHLRGFYRKIYGKDQAKKSFKSKSYSSKRVEVATFCAEGAKGS